MAGRMNIFAKQNRLVRVVERLYGLCRPGRVFSFETEVGVKCRLGRFNSERFRDYVEYESPFLSISCDFADLLMPADFLRDRFTLCGMSLPESPYVRLMEEIASGALAADSEYVSRCRAGTLDSRQPFSPSLEGLQDCYRLRVRELSENRPFYVYVRRVLWRGETAYVIADGKHRAALAASLNRPECLRLRFVSGDALREPFFQQTYAHVLSLDPLEYSINQQMIKAIQDEYEAAGNR
jgi:hypothetical protein